MRNDTQRQLHQRKKNHTRFRTDFIDSERELYERISMRCHSLNITDDEETNQ